MNKFRNILLSITTAVMLGMGSSQAATPGNTFVMAKDIADIIVTHPDEERVRFVAEVKSRRLTFKTAKSYPWPTVFIDTVEGYHAKTTKPAIYVVVSRDSGACIAMPGELTDSWGVTETWDRVRQIKVTNYVSPKEDWTTLRRAVQGVHRNLSSARP